MRLFFKWIENDALLRAAHGKEVAATADRLSLKHGRRALEAVSCVTGVVHAC